MVSVILLVLVGWFGAAAITALVMGAMIARSDADRIPPDRFHSDDPHSDAATGVRSGSTVVDAHDRTPDAVRLP